MSPSNANLIPTYVCMYVCMVMYVRATAYSLDCHVGTMINRRLYKGKGLTAKFTIKKIVM